MRQLNRTFHSAPGRGTHFQDASLLMEAFNRITDSNQTQTSTYTTLGKHPYLYEGSGTDSSLNYLEQYSYNESMILKPMSEIQTL